MFYTPSLPNAYICKDTGVSQEANTEFPSHGFYQRKVYIFNSVGNQGPRSLD